MFLKLSKIFLCAAFFAPAVVLFSTFFPFIGGKYYFFRAATELALTAVILWWGFEAQRGAMQTRLKKLFDEPIVVAVTVFTGIFLIACFLGYDANAAFWSNFERGEGGFQMLHYYLFFLLSLFLLREEKEWKRVLWVAVIASACVVLYGVAAAAHITNFIGPYANGEPTFLGRLFSPDIRFQGSLGNPAYVAPYLIFAMFYTFFLWGMNEGKKRATLRTAGYMLLGLFFLIFFVLTQTKGGGVGLAAATYAFLIYIGFSERRYRFIALVTIAASLIVGGTLMHFKDSIARIPGARLLDLPLSGSQLILGGMGAFLLALFIIVLAEKRYRKWARIGIVGLLIGGSIFVATSGSLARLSDRTANTRFWTWGSAWKGFVERPLLGWGPENFSAVFDKYFDPRHFTPGVDSETWFDRAHSVIFDYLAETGILGFVSYIAMFAAFFWQFIGFSRHRAQGGGDAPKEHPDTRMPFRVEGSSVTRGLLVALPVAYLVQGLAIFDVLPMYINLFFFFALTSYVFSTRTQ